MNFSSTIAEPSDTSYDTPIVRGPLGEIAKKIVEKDEPIAINTQQPITFDNARSSEEIDKEQANWKDLYSHSARMQVSGESGLIDQAVDWWQIQPMHENTGWMHGTPHGETRIDLDGIKHTPWDSIPLRFDSEDDIMRFVQENTGAAHGINNHHPMVANIIARSFEEYAQLQRAYYNS